MAEILIWVLYKFVAVIPGFLLRRLYSPESISSQLRIDLRGEKPISPSLGSSVPHIDIYLNITNLSNIDLKLDQLLLDLWFGQPLLNGVILERIKVPARSADCELFFRAFLSSRQSELIEPYLLQRPPAGSITLTVHGYFDSKVGIVELQDRFERQSVR